MTPCVEWTKYKDEAGYGRRRFEGKTVVAHRVAYAQHHGLDLSDIAGKVIRHKCDNRDAFNGARALAREFGISEGVVSQIVHRKLWKHV